MKKNIWIIVITALITSVITSVFFPLQKIIEQKFVYRQIDVANVTTYWQHRLDAIIDFSKNARGLNSCLEIHTSTSRVERFEYCYDQYATPLFGSIREIDLKFGGGVQDDTEKMEKVANEYMDAYLIEEGYSEKEHEYLEQFEALESLLIEKIDTPFKTSIVQ
ncbi:hypothetical protein C4564_03605 [Candidatus Microgenomates bacterium]|nr:MAG: hypothetical protein C4564_03605 [Candidatus Microgenomates bacterium]